MQYDRYSAEQAQNGKSVIRWGATLNSKPGTQAGMSKARGIFKRVVTIFNQIISYQSKVGSGRICLTLAAFLRSSSGTEFSCC